MAKRGLKLLSSSVCLLILSASSVMAEDPVYFADANLKAAVESELGITDPTPTDMLSLTVLYKASDMEIYDLTGIEYASNLMELSLYSNQITDISPLSRLTNLTHLLLSNNQISDISTLSGLVNLERLTLRNNQVSDISPLSGLTNLTALWLGSNNVSDISALSGLTNLYQLLLPSNQITDISALSGLTSLTELNLGGNQISDLSPLSGLTNLTTIVALDSNQISDLSPLSGLTNLGNLSLGNNQINDISALAGLTSLWGLDLRNNQISKIPDLSGLTSLRRLSLANNQISDISALSGLTGLWSLELMNNPLNLEAYCTYLPLIDDNNPDLTPQCDPNPYPPEACLDDDGKTGGLFSIEGTRWVSCWIGLSTSQPFIVNGCNSMLGFYQGIIYGCVEEDNCNPLPDQLFSYSYYDLLVFSILNVSIHPLSGNGAGSVAIMLPCGLGVERYIGSAPGLHSYIGIMFRVDNDWIPPEFE